MAQNRDNSILSTKRVASNTVFLYVRMLFTMFLALYTSRLLLDVLGVQDFGIYNVVGGFIVLFSFLQGAFSSSATRFMGVAITHSDPPSEVSKVYVTAYALHLGLVVVLIIGLETLGLWYMNRYMNIPAGREHAALWVYQLAVANICLITLRVPDNSLVIAFEKLSFFAVCGIAESVLKLVVVLLLAVSPIDKLVFYSILMLCITLIINIVYFVYAHYYLPVKLRYVHPQQEVVKGMFSLIGWNSLGGFANIGYQQGINLILNFFFGVTLNAAMGIANQVKNAVYSFVINVRTASDPQIIKSFALKEFTFCRQLMSRITRYSHFILLFLVVPVIFNVDFILRLWLKNPPEYAAKLVVLMLVYCVLDGLMGPLWILNQATGKIRKYQIIRAVFYLATIPISYAVMKVWAYPELVIITGILVTMALYIIQIPICIKPIGMRVWDYIKEVLLPIVVVTFVSLSSTFFTCMIPHEWGQLICSILINTAALGFSVYFWGVTSGERQQLMALFKEKLLRNN